MHDIAYGMRRRFINNRVSTSLVLTHKNKDILTNYCCFALDYFITIQYITIYNSVIFYRRQSKSLQKKNLR